ncbi:hypothetical protein X801_08129 [Opisthorchis viverrini]|uniref:Uncharacterized protein n=1 Tax=Opisthorchis viverrini TaxID=6198 RepID=A0A1S8WNR5_OPIVI|nr:hypothetical protein X801_08129 [Opisthorchis viverrini]
MNPFRNPIRPMKKPRRRLNNLIVRLILLDWD